MTVSPLLHRAGRAATRAAGPALFLVLLLARSPGSLADEAEGRPLDRFFRGKVTAFEKGRITLVYDFATDEQSEDWKEALPFPARRGDSAVEWADGKLVIRGSTGVRHVAVWKGDVEVTCRMTLDAQRDLGGYLVPADDAHDFATFTIAEHYFHEWDGQDGGQHAILKFGDKFTRRGLGEDFIGFRYVARQRPAKPLIEGRGLGLSFGLKRGRLFFHLQGQALKGKDKGKKLDLHRPGFYVLQGATRLDDVVLQGRLDDAWMRSAGVLPTLDTPLPED